MGLLKILDNLHMGRRSGKCEIVIVVSKEEEEVLDVIEMILMSRFIGSVIFLYCGMLLFDIHLTINHLAGKYVTKTW
jgi:hypothetical protein